MKGPQRQLPWLLVLVILTAAQPALAADGETQKMIRLDVTIGKSQVVEIKEPFSRVSVTNPAIADVFAVSPTQLLINGKAVGVTSLVVFYPDRTMFFDIVVSTDVELLRERLAQIAPRDEIQVYASKDSIVLSGNVSSSVIIDAAAELASTFVPRGAKVINLLTLTDVKPQQVMLQVHVAEVNRAALRELGFAARILGGETLIGAAFPGAPFAAALGSIGGILETVNTGATIVGATTPDMNFVGQNFFLSSPGRDFAGVVRALAERSLFRTLAKPTLVTQSGKEAKFISGGEFPYPTAIRENTITVTFKEFGIGLVFTPVVVDGEMINLRVLPIVSSLDFSQGLSSAGFRIPVIRKNEAFTTINIRDGESFAVAGLINNEVRQAIAKVPLLGDIPILGALFRSTRFQANETELVFLVTVKLVKPGAPGTASVPDPTKLMELREKERKEFTLVPGIPGVGDLVDRPFGRSNLEGK